MVTGGDDCKIYLWHNATYIFNFMPLRNSCCGMYELGKEDQKWEAIEKVSTNNPGFWYENTQLFFLAIEEKEINFVKKFKDNLVEVIRHTGSQKVCSIDTTPQNNRVDEKFSIRKEGTAVDHNKRRSTIIRSYSGTSVLSDADYKSNDKSYEIKVENGKMSLIEFAIFKSNYECLKIIIECWVKKMNEDIDDLLTQRLYHASYYINKEELRKLALLYPDEFSYFLQEIKLVKSHSSLGDGIEDSKVYLGKMQLKVAASDDRCATNMWNNVVHKLQNSQKKDMVSFAITMVKKYFPPLYFSEENNSKDGEYKEKYQLEKNTDDRALVVTPMYLPVDNACDQDMLELYKKVAHEVGTDVFNTATVRYTLKHLWKQKARIRYSSPFITYSI